MYKDPYSNLNESIANLQTTVELFGASVEGVNQAFKKLPAPTQWDLMQLLVEAERRRLRYQSTVNGLLMLSIGCGAVTSIIFEEPSFGLMAIAGISFSYAVRNFVWLKGWQNRKVSS